MTPSLSKGVGPGYASDDNPPPLLLITNRHQTQGRPLIEVVQRALAVGLPAVQFREPDLSDSEARPLIEALRQETAAHSALLFVNGRPQLARAVGADGLHLGENTTTPPGSVWQGRLSVAAHDRQGLDRAARLGASFALLSPLFATRTHPDMPSLGPQGFRRLASTSTIPVVALGGIHCGNARDAFAVGARGIACIEAIIGTNAVEEATACLLKAATS